MRKLASGLRREAHHLGVGLLLLLLLKQLLAEDSCGLLGLSRDGVLRYGSRRKRTFGRKTLGCESCVSRLDLLLKLLKQLLLLLLQLSLTLLLLLLVLLLLLLENRSDLAHLLSQGGISAERLFA